MNAKGIIVRMPQTTEEIVKALKLRDASVATPGQTGIYRSQTLFRRLKAILQREERNRLNEAVNTTEKRTNVFKDFRHKRLQKLLQRQLELGEINGAMALLQRDVDVNFVTRRGLTPLLYAIQRADIDFLLYCLAKSCDPNEPGNTNKAPVYHCIESKQHTLLQSLCEHGADPDGWCTLSNGEQVTALMLAAAIGDKKGAKLLIQCGADPHALSWPSGRNALMYAARYQQVRTSKLCGDVSRRG